MVLKPLEDAIADNDSILGIILNTCTKILGIILNICTNHSAESPSITRPRCDAQKSLFRRLLGPLQPSSVSYVEMHDTGTQVGDTTEMMSVIDCFAPDVGPRRRPADCPVHVGSVKSNISHGGAAAGVMSLIKMLLMLQHNAIPPHCSIKTKINSSFPENLSRRGVLIAKESKAWRRQHGTSRKAVINNFSAAGGNTALLLQDPPERNDDIRGDPCQHHIIAISAKSPSALKANARNLIAFLGRMSGGGTLLSSLSYTTTARRMHHAHRICVNGSTTDESAQAISKAIERYTGDSSAGSKLRSPKIIFAFTGQGSHYLGMGSALWRYPSSFRADICRYDQLACSFGFPAILPIVEQEHSQTVTSSTTTIQLAVTCLQTALARLWRSWGIELQAVIGHSLRHYAALNAAGVISEADTIFLVGNRAKVLEESCPPGTHCMLAAEISPDAIQQYLTNAKVELACVNGPRQLTVGGSWENIESLKSDLEIKGIKFITIDTAQAYHTSQMDRALNPLEQATKGATIRRPSIRVICSLRAAILNEKSCFDASHFSHHLRKPVRFTEALHHARETRVITPTTRFLEVGPDSVLCRMIKATLGNSTMTLPSLQAKTSAWKVVTSTLSSLYTTGATIHWVRYDHDFVHAQHVLSLPSYAWDLSSYWIDYRHDWWLRKGDPPSRCQPCGFNIQTITVHEVVQASIDQAGGSMTVRLDLSQSGLSNLVRSHRVDGSWLCTPVRISFLHKYQLGRPLHLWFTSLTCIQVSPSSDSFVHTVTILLQCSPSVSTPLWMTTCARYGDYERMVHISSVGGFRAVLWPTKEP